MRTAYCVNLGCSENALDGALISHYLNENDWRLVDRPEAADLIIVNSCGFTEWSERDSLRVYRDLAARKRADARIVFAGCLPAINKQAVRDAGYDDVLVTPRKLSVLDSVIDATVPIDTLRSGCVPASSDRIGVSFAGNHYDVAQRAARGVLRAVGRRRLARTSRLLLELDSLPDRDTEFVRISVGCLNTCSFCSIPRAKGTTRSVPLETVIGQVRAALARGKTSIALSCDELGSYGQDLGADIAALMADIVALPHRFEIKLRNAHPEWMIRYWPGLKPSFATGKIAHLVLPLQSGSDRTLRAMQRNHTAEQARWLLREIRETCPTVVVRTHWLVGFPGETEQDFMDTLRFVDRAQIDSFCVHCYSERRFTPSASLADKVPAEIAERRARALARLDAFTRFQEGYWRFRDAWSRARRWGRGRAPLPHDPGG
jgi:tRNA A37 methylthiotransferase MiaB